MLFETPLVYAQEASSSATREETPAQTITTPAGEVTLPAYQPDLDPSLPLGHEEAGTTPQASAELRKRVFLKRLSKRVFSTRERITLDVMNAKGNTYQVKILDSKNQPAAAVVAEKQVGEDKELVLAAGEEMTPGKYTIIVSDNQGIVSKQEFLWGVLALNTDRDVYLPGETASIAMAVLDERGEMVCDAKITLEIHDPKAELRTLSSDAGSITRNPACFKKELQLEPDYQASYTTELPGTYTVRLTAQTKNGTYSINDSFSVREQVPLRVKRTSATRLYPPETYPVTFSITPAEDFTGTVTEIVPESFTVTSLEEDQARGVRSDFSVAIADAKTQREKVLGNAVVAVGMPFRESDTASSDSAALLTKHPITLGFGKQIDDPLQKIKYSDFGLIGHDGVDFSMPEGTPIIAVDDGDVVLAQEKSDYGTTIVLQHAWGRSYYGHLSKLEVEPGMHVGKGGEIGLSGDTGITTGPHLHFGIKPNTAESDNGYFGKVDPAPYLGLSEVPSVLGAATGRQERVKVLTWQVDVKKGETVTLGYAFKAPNKSPQYYTLGPLTARDAEQHVVYEEQRSWQLAVDAYAGSQIKTVEYILGGGTDGTSRATTNVVYAGSSWNTTKASAGTETVFLAGTNISVRNAYLEARTVRQTAANITDVDMTFDANPGPNAGNDTRVSPVIQGGANYQGSTGLSQWLMVRADVTSQLETQSDTDWSTGVAIVSSLSVTGPSFAASTMKLVITYESDYTTTSHTEIKTVRFPLDSDVAGDTGSTRAACAASTTCTFSYNAQIPDLLSSSNSNIKSAFFELHANSDSATAPSITPQVQGGTAGATFSDQEIIADVRDMYVLYKPGIGGSDFSPNAAGKLDILNGSVPLNTLGGELVVTYLYSTGAATQTDTVRYWVQQQTAETSTTKTAFPDGASNITIANTGLSVKNLWYRVHTAHAAAQTFTVFGKVGAATEKSNAYTLTGTNARAGETTLIYDMSADAASFNAATTKVTGASQFSSATGDTEVSAELFVTFTWSGSSGGTQTKTVLYNAGTSPINSVVAAEYHNFPTNIFLPESVTKTHRSTYIDTAQMHSQSATTISVATLTTYLNGSSILALSEQDDTEAFSRTYIASVSASLFTGDSSPTATTIDFSRRNFTVSETISNANILTVSNVYVITYDAAFSENGTTENSKSLRTVEYVLGGGSDSTSRATATTVYGGSSWNTTKASAGTVTVEIPGSGIQVRNAYLEARFTASTATNLTDVDMLFDASPGPTAGTDGRVSPVIQGTYWAQSGLSYWVLVRGDVTSLLSIQSDSQWNAGVAVVSGISVTGPTTQLNSLKLVVTYEQDYSASSHTELKTVRFPLDSMTAGDTGSKRAACAATTTCSYAYNAQIPDLLSNDTANIESVFFELHGDSDSATSPGFTPQINGGTAGASMAEGDIISDMRDMYVLYQPIIGGPDFTPNTAQQLDIVNGAVALNALGGELVVTYKYSTGAATQTETVRYFAQQQTAETGTTKTAFANSSYTVSNAGFSVKNLWYKVTTANSAANTLTIFGKVGAATEQSNAYTLTGTGARGGEAVIIYDMSADAASFNAATTTVTGNSQWSSATGDTEVGAELYLTFTWSGSSQGTQTKTILYNGGTSGGGSSVANEYHNFTPYIFLPEDVTKTYRSAYIQNTLMHSNATTIGLTTVSLAFNGTTGLSLTEQDDTEAFSRTYLETISAADFSGGANIAFQRRSYGLTQSISSANRATFSNQIVVTYDADFASSGGVETPTLDKLMRHGKWFNSSGVRQPFTF